MSVRSVFIGRERPHKKYPLCCSRVSLDSVSNSKEKLLGEKRGEKTQRMNETETDDTFTIEILSTLHSEDHSRSLLRPQSR